MPAPDDVALDLTLPGDPVPFDAGDDAPVPGAPAPAPTDLEALREELARDEAEVAAEAAPPVTYRSPGRDRYALRFSTNLLEEQLEVGRKQARAGNRAARRGRVGGADDDLDQLKWFGWILATYNTAILRDGEELLTAEGRPLRFSTREFLDITAQPTVLGAIRRWFAGADGAIIGMGRAVVAASPYGTEPEDGEVDVVSPTRLD